MVQTDAKKLNIGVLLYTFDRVEDAYINQEIIRNVWGRSGLFGQITIVHAYNGKNSWYPKKYLENIIIRQKNAGHFQGATELIDAGMHVFRKRYPKIPYIVVIASDTWVLRPHTISTYIRTLQKKNLWLACSPWDKPDRKDIPDVGISLDFFILDAHWEKRHRMFPLAYQRFHRRYSELLLYWRGTNVSPEKLFFARYLQAVGRAFGQDVGRREFGIRKLLLMKKRFPVHSHSNSQGFWIRNHFWPKIGLLTHHDPIAKQRVFQKYPHISGEHAEKFRNAKNLFYFNRHVQIRGENPA